MLVEEQIETTSLGMNLAIYFKNFNVFISLDSIIPLLETCKCNY